MKIIGFDGRCRGCALIAPAGQELIQGAGFKHRAGDDMRAYFRALLQQTDAQIAPRFPSHLSKPD